MAGICLVLIALVFAVFGRAIGNGFVEFDDNVYIYQNPVISRGLTYEGFRWALTYAGIGHWHPLTWISHMLDCQVFGMWAGGHHLTSLFFHASNAVLLFLVLLRMTGASWRCAFAAALWAIHPLRAESVVWIAERKDVLSAFFFMLTLAAYLYYLRRPSRWRYLIVTLVFAAGLLSKDMLVTLPFVLLLLDYWPLGRIGSLMAFRQRIVEKVPWFILSVISCVITLLAPEKIILANRVPLWLRLENALIACCIYLRQSFWPAGLAAFYPYPLHAYPIWNVAGALALIGVLTAGVLALHRSRPYLVTGWFWFLGMLVPVLGFVQAATSGRADRYTYLPQIGLIICLVWLVGDWVGKSAGRGFVSASAGLAILSVFSIGAFWQTGYWHDSQTLWNRAIDVSPDNFVAHSYLGIQLLEDQSPADAVAQFQRAVQINPSYAPAYNGMGDVFIREGKLDDAIAAYRKATNLEPYVPEYHGDLGVALVEKGNADDGIAEFREGLRAAPKTSILHFDLGLGLMQQRHVSEAIAEYRKAVEMDPDYSDAHENLANALQATGDIPGAIAEYRQAIRCNPGYPGAHYGLGVALIANREISEAVAEMKRAVQLAPDNFDFVNRLAWMLATAPDVEARDGRLAIALATKTTQATNGRNPVTVRTLAAGYAQVGRFQDAVDAAQSALALAQMRGDGELANSIERELDLYQHGRAYPASR